jgi:hypothetical protein
MSIIAEPPEKASGASLVHVKFQNAGDEDVILNLGMMLGNGKVLLADAIRMRLIDE